MQAYRQAISLAAKKLDVNSRDAYTLGVLAYCHAMLGDRTLALNYLRKAMKLAPQDSGTHLKAALVYNQFGDTAQTLHWLKQAVASGTSTATLRDTPNFNSLRSDPRFQQIAQSR
jgi:Flp pilus assembly protein TadD